MHPTMSYAPSSLPTQRVVMGGGECGEVSGVAVVCLNGVDAVSALRQTVCQHARPPGRAQRSIGQPSGPALHPEALGRPHGGPRGHP